MQVDVHGYLGKALADEGYTGDVQVTLSRSVARQIIDGYIWNASDLQKPEDVAKIPPQIIGAATITYELGDLRGDVVAVRSDGETTWHNARQLVLKSRSASGYD